jgi:hypothetical protein
MKITRRQLRKLISEVFKKGLSTKAIRHMSGLDDETISTIEDLENQGPDYRATAQQLAKDMGSLEPEAYYYDMGQPIGLDPYTSQKGISLMFYKYHLIYDILVEKLVNLGRNNDKRFVLGSDIKKQAKAKLGDKFEEIKYAVALNDLLKLGSITKKEEMNWDSGKSRSETYYAATATADR